MQNFLTTMLTPAWLISTVVVGILLNVVSGYLKDGIDKSMATMGRRAEQSRSRRTERRWRQIHMLANDREYNRRLRVRIEMDGFLGKYLVGAAAFLLFAALMYNVSHPVIFAATIMEKPTVVVPAAVLFLLAGFCLMAGLRYLGRRTLHKIYLIVAESYVGESFESIYAYATATEQTGTMGDQREGR